MANKVIQLTEIDPLPKSNEALQKWMDIDIDSTKNWKYRQAEAPMLSDFVSWLATELDTNVEQPTEDNLSVFATEGQNATSDQISAIAIVCNVGYAEAFSKYEEWIKPYKWRISKLVNVKAVQNSLKNIFTWIRGERILNPEFGSNLKLYLYQGIVPETSEKIMAEIRHCITEWEPRVNLVQVVDVSTLDDHEDNTIHLEIVYTIPELSDEQYTYSFYYKRGE